MPDPDNPEAWESVAKTIHALAPNFERDLAYFRSHIPDPARHPVTYAVVTAYAQRLEMALEYSRRGVQGLKDQAANHPDLLPEIEAIMRWIKVRKPNPPRGGLSREDEDEIGDWLVKYIEPSYSKARQFIAGISKSLAWKGAPNKRPETIMMLDARIANGWSYATIAAKMCDCGAKKHNEYCRERIRKRIKELESFLRSMGITYTGEK
jgi:hypothetical protein